MWIAESTPKQVRLILSAGRKEYFVKWVGYDSSQNTWEPENHLSTVKDLIQKLNSSQGKKDESKSVSSSKKKPQVEDISNGDDLEVEDEDDIGSLGSFGVDFDSAVDKVLCLI